jgi:DNA polymerase V
MWALVDANNMFASCERAMNPALVGRALVVLSSNDGAVIARSNEAKELGIGMAQPWFQVKHLERTAGLIALSANFTLYSDLSARMMAIEARYAPTAIVYSIDESFLDFEGVRDDLVETGRSLRAAVLRETGLPTSVGFGATKTLAKLANHIAKTADRKPGSYPAQLAQVCDFGRLDQRQLDYLFKRTEVGEIWGVGRRIGEKLRAGGVHTVLDLVHADSASLRREFSVVLEKTVLELRGTSCIEMDEAPAPKQQILVSRSFGTPITDVDGIVEAVSEFTSRAAERLRQQDSVAGSVGVFFMTSAFRQNDPQHAVNVTVPLLRPTADTRLLVSAAVRAARQQFREGFRYAKAGAMMIDLRPSGQEQHELDLFSAMEAEPAGPSNLKREALMATMDSLNLRFGRDSLRVGSTALASNGAEVNVWATKQERRSPRYTTCWDEMPIAHAEPASMRNPSI